jgi:hypothetical protein
MMCEKILRRSLWTMEGLAVMGAFAGCVSAPVSQVPVGPPDTTVYFYPTRNQPSTQQDRDRYECHLWAVQQSGFDPNSSSAPPHLRTVMVAGPPPGSGVAAGAVTGALVGAAISRPWEAGPAALVGAIAGAAIGGAAESAATDQAREQAAASANNARAAALEHQASDYRRAMTACLEGRGYTVR